MHAKNLPSTTKETHKSREAATIPTSVHYLKRLGRFPRLDRINASHTVLKWGQMANRGRVAARKIQTQEVAQEKEWNEATAVWLYLAAA